MCSEEETKEFQIYMKWCKRCNNAVEEDPEDFSEYVLWIDDEEKEEIKRNVTQKDIDELVNKIINKE